MKKVKIILLLVLVIAGSLFIIREYLKRKYYKEQELILQKNKLFEQETEKYNDSLCECEKEKVREYLKRNIYLVTINVPFVEDIVYKDYKMHYAILPDCGEELMDSAIFKKFGKDFYKKIEHKSDSLYSIYKCLYLDLNNNYYSAETNPINKYINKTIYQYVIDSLKKINLDHLSKKECIPNKLQINVVISIYGDIKDVDVIRSVNPEIDSVVYNIIKTIPGKWIPAKFKGENVNFKYELIIYF